MYFCRIARREMFRISRINSRWINGAAQYIICPLTLFENSGIDRDIRRDAERILTRIILISYDDCGLVYFYGEMIKLLTALNQLLLYRLPITEQIVSRPVAINGSDKRSCIFHYCSPSHGRSKQPSPAAEIAHIINNEARPRAPIMGR